MLCFLRHKEHYISTGNQPFTLLLDSLSIRLPTPALMGFIYILGRSFIYILGYLYCW